jgi:prepilin-type N-terminal cleavage/methylation domain-containing protein
MNHFHRRSSIGFTLIEMLTVIAIIVLLAGLLLPAINMARNKAKAAKAQAEINQIVTAIRAYYLEYGRFPHGNGNAADYNYGASLAPGPAYSPNARLMSVLRAVDDGLDPSVGNGGHTNNLKKIVFLEISPKSLDTTNNFLDPFGNQYEITVDTGFDNICNNMAASYPNVTGRTMVVWSLGIDKKANTADDLKSWQ